MYMRVRLCLCVEKLALLLLPTPLLLQPCAAASEGKQRTEDHNSESQGGEENG
jgi:hypothetical protein